MDREEAFLKLLATSEPASLGPGPRKDVLSRAELDSRLAGLFDSIGLPPGRQPLVQGLVLLWHDHLEAAHKLAQAIENPDGSLVHAIMHRREPDYWNSKYWWQRVGRHPIFGELAGRVTDFLEARGEHELLAQIVPQWQWDAFAFVDVCEVVAGDSTAAAWVAALCEVQRLEFETALSFFLRESPR